MNKPAPTIAEEHLARLIARWHGSTILFRRPDGQWMTVSDLREKPSGWAERFEVYAERHWEEYVQAARAILRARS